MKPTLAGRCVFPALLAALTLAITAPAQASVLDFEDFPFSETDPYQYVPAPGYHGFYWHGSYSANSWVVMPESNDLYAGTQTHSGSRYAWNNGGGHLVLQRVDNPVAFDLDSLWIRGAHAGMNVTFEGIRSGSLAYSRTFDLSDTFALATLNFKDIDIFVLREQSAGNFLLDDISYSVSAVPESQSHALFVLGLGLLVATRRAGNKASQRRALRSLAVLGAGLACAAQVQAVSLNVVNAGFESPSLRDTAFTSNILPGWVGTDSTSAIWNFGAYNPPTGYFPGQAPEGLNVAYIERGAIYQTLGDVLVANTDYSLSVWVGDSLVNTLPGFAVQLRAGGTVLAEATGPAPTNGSFQRVSLSFSSGVHPLAGQALQIWLIENDPIKSSEAFFDDVRLSAMPSAVPEPGSAGLVLAGLALLAYAAKRRRG